MGALPRNGEWKRLIKRDCIPQECRGARTGGHPGPLAYSSASYAIAVPTGGIVCPSLRFGSLLEPWIASVTSGSAVISGFLYSTVITSSPL